jgi:hypothetical protein
MRKNQVKEIKEKLNGNNINQERKDKRERVQGDT